MPEPDILVSILPVTGKVMIVGSHPSAALRASFEHITTTNQSTSYYMFGGPRLRGDDGVAMRVAGAVYWLHGDHLGSASLTTNVSGQKVAELRYLPFGETRWAWGTTPTDRRYTGQREVPAIGLYDYNARMYWPGAGRFVSADTVVPGPFSPQHYNRYLYVLGNPLRLVDPSGHDPLDQEWIAEFSTHHHRAPTLYDRLIRLFSIAFPSEWQNGGWSRFYDSQGQLRSDSTIREVLITPSAGRSWASMPDALANLAAFYKSSDTEAFVRDVGSLFGGLPDRFDESSLERATTTNPVHHWAYLNRDGLDPRATLDNGGNVHHWAWAFVLGYRLGAVAVIYNIGREANQAGGGDGRDIRTGFDIGRAFADRGSAADIWLGNVGALLGVDVKTFGVSPWLVRALYAINMHPVKPR